MKELKKLFSVHAKLSRGRDEIFAELRRHHCRKFGNHRDKVMHMEMHVRETVLRSGRKERNAAKN
jgi:hypothetical protein